MVKFYSEKSKARRALNSIGVAALQAAEKLLVQGNDDRWGFNEDEAERIQSEADSAKTDIAPTSAPSLTSMVSQLMGSVVKTSNDTFHSTIIKGGKKVVENGKKVVVEKPAKEAASKKETKQVQAPKPVKVKSQGFNQTGIHKCPSCGVIEDQTWSNENVSLFCHPCGTTYSATTGRKIRSGYTREGAPSGYTIDKERPQQNGVRRPSAGTICGKVWAAFDAVLAEKGVVNSTDLPQLAEANDWNRNNVSCEFYVWRKFNGISGRKA